MNLSPLVLLTGIVEHLVNKAPLPIVAKNIGAEYEDLSAVMEHQRRHTWRGKLILALNNPDFPPRQIPLLTHLARLEEKYAELMAQYHRAEQTCTDLRNDTQQITHEFRMKADVFANRIHQQITRILRDIDKAEQRLDKISAENELPQNNVAANLSVESAQRAVEGTPEVTQVNDSVTRSPQPESEPAPTQIENTPEFNISAEELHSIVIRHRQRIKSTPEKDRQTLIAQLVEQHRAKKNAANQSTSHRNARRAA